MVDIASLTTLEKMISLSQQVSAEDSSLVRGGTLCLLKDGTIKKVCDSVSIWECHLCEWEWCMHVCLCVSAHVVKE